MATLNNAHFLDSDIAGTASGSDSWTTTGQARTTAFPQDYAHLNGQTVDVIDDGVVGDDQVVGGGTLPSMPTGTYHIGLNYVTTIKPSKLDIEGMGIMLVKKITKVIISFYQTLKGKVGPDTTRMETISFGTTLFDGVKVVPINDGYDRDADIIVQQDEPLPLICRGLIMDTGVYVK